MHGKDTQDDDSPGTIESGSSSGQSKATLTTPQSIQELRATVEDMRKKQEWASWVNTQYTKCRNARMPFERQWYLNLAFAAGRQYVSPIEVPGEGFRLTAPKSPPWRVRLVVNKVRTAVRTQTAKLTSNKPIATVAPATNEDEDWSAAQTGEQLLKAKFLDTNFNKTFRSWIWWGTIAGNSYLKQYWDPMAPDYDSMSLPPRPSFPDPNDPEAPPVELPDEVIEKDPRLNAYFNTPRPAQGKICISRVTPFHLFVPDMLCEDIDEQPFVIEVMVKSPEWVKSRYGFVPTLDTRASSSIMNASVIIAKGSEDHLDAVMVKEVWIKPGGHKDFPQGGMLTVINNKIVQCHKVWPLPFPEYPYYKYDDLDTGGFYKDSIIVDLIPLQKEYNRTRSQAIEIKNVMGKPRLVYPKGSINPRMISSEPGQSVPYTPGFEKPQVMPGVEVPASFSIEMDRLNMEFDDVSAQHEISRGQTPSSQLTSGTAISYLGEQDSNKLTYQVASIEAATEKMGKHYLIYVSKYWQSDRVVKTVGKDKTYEAIHWKKNALKGNTDVRVQAGSALPESKAAKQAFITELMTLGFMPPEVGLEIMDMGGYEKMVEEFLVDKRAAQRENLKIVDAPDDVMKMLMEPPYGPEGEPPMEIPDLEDPSGNSTMWLNWDGTPFQPQPPIPVNSWDNHEAHIKWHNQFRKGQEFEMLSDIKKKALELHVQLHQIALMGGQMSQQGMLTQPGAMPPEPPPDPNALPPGEGDPNAEGGDPNEQQGPPQDGGSKSQQSPANAGAQKNQQQQPA